MRMQELQDCAEKLGRSLALDTGYTQPACDEKIAQLRSLVAQAFEEGRYQERSETAQTRPSLRAPAVKGFADNGPGGDWDHGGARFAPQDEAVRAYDETLASRGSKHRRQGDHDA